METYDGIITKGNADAYLGICVPSAFWFETAGPGKEVDVSYGEKSVAIVDDDEALLEATSDFLNAMGYHPIPFSSGESFLRSEHIDRISTLVTDINMPGMTGLELQQIVRARYPGISVIMMTALRDESIRRKALAGGARELLQKPVLADDLIRCLENE